MHTNTRKSLVALLVLVLLSACVPASLSSAQDDLVLSEGTAITVVTAQEITSKKAKPNDPVNFTVTEDVSVGGQVIVRNGTPAIGSVITAIKGGYMGNSGKLAIQVESTTTVDGQKLKLRAAKGGEGDDKTTSTFALASIISPLFLFRRGGEAKVTAGMPITVYVAEEKRFRVDGSTLVAITPENPAATNSEDATVFIYRPKKLVGKGLEPSVFVDEVELARMDNGRYFALKLKPGKHIVHMTDEKIGYAIDMGPGQSYYFRVGLEAGMWKGKGKIVLDEPQRAVKEIKKLKFIGQDKIKAPTLVVDIAPK